MTQLTEIKEPQQEPTASTREPRAPIVFYPVKRLSFGPKRCTSPGPGATDIYSHNPDEFIARAESSDSEDSMRSNSSDAPTFIMDRFTSTKKQPSWLEFIFWQTSYSPLPSSAQLNTSPTGIADMDEMDTGCAIALN